MDVDRDTFLVTVYCTVDDLYREQIAGTKPSRPGHCPEVSDSEGLTLALLAQWRKDRSERAFLAHVRQHWRSYFPRLLSQSAFNRRTRDLAGVLARLGPLIAQRVQALLPVGPLCEVVDGVPVPLMRRCRGNRHRLFADVAAIGRGGSDREWYYGVKIVATVTHAGPISGFVSGPATTDERWLAEALWRWRRTPQAPAPTVAELAPLLGPTHKAGGDRTGPTGPIGSRWGAGAPSPVPCLADLGFSGTTWAQHWQQDYGATVLTKDPYRSLEDPVEKYKGLHLFASLRQVIETVNNTLTGVFGLSFPRARTDPGLLTRLAAKVAAFNVAVYVNHLYERPIFSIFDPLA